MCVPWVNRLHLRAPIGTPPKRGTGSLPSSRPSGSCSSSQFSEGLSLGRLPQSQHSRWGKQPFRAFSSREEMLVVSSVPKQTQRISQTAYELRVHRPKEITDASTRDTDPEAERGCNQPGIVQRPKRCTREGTCYPEAEGCETHERAVGRGREISCLET